MTEYTNKKCGVIEERINNIETNMADLRLTINVMNDTSQHTQNRISTLITNLTSYSDTTNEAIKHIQSNLQDHQLSSTTVLEAITNKLTDIPSSDNLRSFEITPFWLESAR